MTNPQDLTIQDCIDKHNLGYNAWIENGKLIGFVHEESVADCKSNNA